MYWTVHLEGGPRRVNHAAAAVVPHIYSFGGYCTGDNYGVWRPIDCHILDTESLRWKLNPTTVQIHNYDWRTSNVPYQRYGHSVVANGDYIYLWGGRNDQRADEALYCFDTVSRQWIARPKVSGCIPGARDGHTAVVINDKMYIFGGYEEVMERFSNDIYVLDLKTFEWKYLRAKGTPPSWRDFHSAIGLDNKMFVFGGRSDLSGPNHSQQEIYCNLIMYFDVITNTWVQPQTYGSPPMGRRSHSSFVYNNEIYIFGGYNGVERVHFNDLFKFDPKENLWSKLEVEGRHKPCPRRRQCCCVVGDRLYLFGGTRFAQKDNICYSYLCFSPALKGHYYASEHLLDHSDLCILDFKPSLRTLCILVAIQNKEELKKHMEFLPKHIQMDIDIMTRNNCISRNYNTG